jgi:hypothetical protein
MCLSKHAGFLFGSGFLWGFFVGVLFGGSLMVLRFWYVERQDLKAGCPRRGFCWYVSFLFTWQHGSPPGIQVGLNSMLAKLVKHST